MGTHFGKITIPVPNFKAQQVADFLRSTASDVLGAAKTGVKSATSTVRSTKLRSPLGALFIGVATLFASMVLVLFSRSGRG